MKIRICAKCKEEKFESDFYTKTSVAGGKKFYNSYCKICEIERTSLNIKKLKILIVEMMGGKCSICGYSKCNSALECHHIERESKEHKINSARSLSKKIKEELSKCILVCANCHREIHWPN